MADTYLRRTLHHWNLLLGLRIKFVFNLRGNHLARFVVTSLPWENSGRLYTRKSSIGMGTRERRLQTIFGSLPYSLRAFVAHRSLAVMDPIETATTNTHQLSVTAMIQRTVSANTTRTLQTSCDETISFERVALLFRKCNEWKNGKYIEPRNIFKPTFPKLEGVN
jgi:hypothetical protein